MGVVNPQDKRTVLKELSDRVGGDRQEVPLSGPRNAWREQVRDGAERDPCPRSRGLCPAGGATLAGGASEHFPGEAGLADAVGIGHDDPRRPGAVRGSIDELELFPPPHERPAVGHDAIVGPMQPVREGCRSSP